MSLDFPVTSLFRDINIYYLRKVFTDKEYKKDWLNEWGFIALRYIH